MTSPRLEPESLVVLARRGQLSNQEAEEFERLTRANTNVADWYRWGCAFDRVDAVQSGDEALLARSVERVVGQRYASRGAPVKVLMSRRIAAWLVAAVVLGTAASALGVVGYFVAKSKEVAPSTVVPTTATGASASPSRSRARAAVVERSAASVETSSAQEPGEVPVASRAVAAQPTAASAKPQPTTEERVDVPTAAFDLESEPTMAAEMFQLANEARRQGSTALAIRRYRELQRRFSSSAEAHLSYVSLGKVLQLSGDSAAAVQEFSRYLARSGALEEEALVGRAEGLATLGRSADELSTWQRLLARFPGSVYAGRARERLAALGVQNRQ